MRVVMGGITGSERKVIVAKIIKLESFHPSEKVECGTEDGAKCHVDKKKEGEKDPTSVMCPILFYPVPSYLES